MWTKRGWIRGALAIGAFVGMMGCGEPFESLPQPNPAAADAAPLPPLCNIPPDYTFFGDSCGGSKINGFACATGCVMTGGGDAGLIPMAIGCRIPDRIGVGIICVADCRDCQ